MMMADKKHPGKITFVECMDGVEKVVKVEDVLNVPESMRFRKDASGKDVPVVKTVAMKTADGRVREIIEYGPKGEFLRSTVAAPSPPRQGKPQPEPKPARK